MKNISVFSIKKILQKVPLISIVVPTIIFASDVENKSTKISGEEFLLEVSKNDVLYEKFDSPMSQFDKFFGLKKNYENNDQINFNDLSITVDSKNIRDLYNEKLRNMRIENDKNTNPFYLEKI